MVGTFEVQSQTTAREHILLAVKIHHKSVAAVGLLILLILVTHRLDD